MLLAIQLGVGVDLCCYHPGDKRAYGVEDTARVGDSSQLDLTLRKPAPNPYPPSGQAPNVGHSKTRV